MRSPAAYYMMLLYVTVMIKPLIPIMQDAWSHEFNEIEHLSCVHAKYGNNHLQKELGTESDNDEGKNQNSLRSEDQVPFHVLTTGYNDNFKINKSLLPYHRFKLDKLPCVYVSLKDQPPKFS
ncbi:MAG: hypothetical protein ABJA71_11620 [Ginsengibacter sp.]